MAGDEEQRERLENTRETIEWMPIDRTRHSQPRLYTGSPASLPLLLTVSSEKKGEIHEWKIVGVGIPEVESFRKVFLWGNTLSVVDFFPFLFFLFILFYFFFFFFLDSEKGDNGNGFRSLNINFDGFLRSKEEGFFGSIIGYEEMNNIE